MALKNDSINLTNSIFFTEKDDNISGSTQRDPLGFQPIWSYFGRQVINHLTTISTNIHGFREVLLCLSICREIHNKSNKFAYQDLILLFEQLFIYTAISKNRSEGILGADNGTAKFLANNKNPKIQTDDTILVRELSLGYFGRYKSPMSTMGIINDNIEIEIELNTLKNLYGENLYSEILTGFESFLDSKHYFNNFKVQESLYKAVFGKFRLGECEFWKKKLYEVNNQEKELMKLCFEKTNDNIEPKALFSTLSDRNEVSDILKLEPFLRCLENVFYKAMVSKDLTSIIIGDIEEHKNRYKDFCSISNQNDSELFNKRMNFIKEKCSPESSNYLENVIKYHELVCEQKKSSVWLELDKDRRIQSFVNADEEIDIYQWGRNYYLSSLKSIKAEILEFSK